MSFVHDALPACMGGFCKVRGSCQHYHSTNNSHPVDRLCSPLRSDMWAPMSFTQQSIAEHYANVMHNRERVA